MVLQAFVFLGLSFLVVSCGTETVFYRVAAACPAKGSHIKKQEKQGCSNAGPHVSGYLVLLK
jgi:hypothetical protein